MGGALAVRAVVNLPVAVLAHQQKPLHIQIAALDSVCNLVHQLGEPGRIFRNRHFERKFDDAGDASDFEGYTLVDAALGYRSGKHRISLSAMNLFDKYYVSYNSDTVAATDPTRFFAGRGRTFTLGLTSNF